MNKKMAKDKVITICSPHQGQIVAVTDKGKVVVAKDVEDFKKQVEELNKK